MTQESQPHPLLRLAFRPFFFSAALFGLLAMLIWIASLTGQLSISPHGGAYLWHAHEMMFGFVMAVVAGFLLTAVKNWTARPGIAGRPLLMLVALWLAGRLCMALNIPASITVTVDLLFLPLVAWSLARPVLAVKQYRNLIFVPLLTLMTLGNGLFHWGLYQQQPALALQGIYLAGWMVVFIMTLLGGRILPMFTANGSQTARVNNLPWLEIPVIAGSLLFALLQGTGLSDHLPAWLNGILAVLLGGLFALRLARLHFSVTLKVPLLWSLHLAFWFLPALYLLLAWHYLAPTGLMPVSKSTAMHLLFAGAMSNMILAMMARVALGHTGRPLTPAPVMSIAFGAACCAALIRVMGVWLWPALSTDWYVAAGLLWLLAYGIFCAVYWPILSRPRIDGKPG